MITLIVYGSKETHAERERNKLAKEYLQGAICCEGAESRRYLDIYSALKSGCTYINSDDDIFE